VPRGGGARSVAARLTRGRHRVHRALAAAGRCSRRPPRHGACCP